MRWINYSETSTFGQQSFSYLFSFFFIEMWYLAAVHFSLRVELQEQFRKGHLTIGELPQDLPPSMLGQQLGTVNLSIDLFHNR